MLAIPEEVSKCAKLRSPAADPSGTPSSRICVPEAPSSTPLPPLSSSALRSSFHVVSNCCEVFAWPNSYSRANFRRIFRLRTNARAPPRVSVPIRVGPQSCPSSAPFYSIVLLLTADSLVFLSLPSTLESLLPRHKPPRSLCIHLNIRFDCRFDFLRILQ